MAKKDMAGFSMPRKEIVELEDLRDDCIGIVLESRLSFKEVHARGGPTPQTIGKWLYRETRFPQLGTVRAILKACEYDLTIEKRGNVQVRKFSTEGINYPEQVQTRKANLREIRKAARKTARRSLKAA